MRSAHTYQLHASPFRDPYGTDPDEPHAEDARGPVRGPWYQPELPFPDDWPTVADLPEPPPLLSGHRGDAFHGVIAGAADRVDGLLHWDDGDPDDLCWAYAAGPAEGLAS